MSVIVSVRVSACDEYEVSVVSAKVSCESECNCGCPEL